MKISLKFILLITFCTFSNELISQSSISGNAQLEMQYYRQDTAIGTPIVPEQLLSQGYLNLFYSQGNVLVGFRYENYSNPLLGYPTEWKGNGVANRFVTYSSDFIDVTAGNYYEQFGSGILLRGYEEKALGVDNSFDGVRLKVRPLKGIDATVMYGRQRFFWAQSPGIVRAGDLNINLNDLCETDLLKDTRVTFGLSGVSRFQEDLQTTYNFPLNVMSYSARMNIATDNLSFDAEYANKMNDPNATNRYNFNPGNALNLNASYFTDGLSINLNSHYIDNMDFRSSRDVLGNRLNLNFIPALTRQHTYRLATIYPYATQFNGEIGVQLETNFQIPKESFLGGKYGTNVAFNYSRVNSIDTSRLAVPLGSRLDDGFAYNSSFYGDGGRTYFQDLNIEITTNITEDFKNTLMVANWIYDKDLLENGGARKVGKAIATVLVYDATYKINKTNAIRMELQHLWAKLEFGQKEPDNLSGNWVMGLLEYTIAPKWFFTLYDEYNYGNKFEEKQLHYLNYALAYFVDGTRLSMTYGRQRGGLLCVGGVCRPVPASNGLYFVMSTSF